MGLFGRTARDPKPIDGPEATGEHSSTATATLPPRFEAVSEAMASGPTTGEAYVLAGRDLAKDGASLEEALDSLRDTSHRVKGQDPTYDEIRALCLGWSEATLGFVHQISCEDPMTGLASLQHLRSRLIEQYHDSAREGVPVRESHALVVADTLLPVDAEVGPLTRTMRLVSMADTARAVFAHGEPIGRLGPLRLAVLARRDELLGRRVALLRRMLIEVDRGAGDSRVWIEGLPPTDLSCAGLLDELSRA